MNTIQENTSIENLLESAETQVMELLDKQLPLSNYYHNLKHTQRVLKYAKRLAREENLSEKDKELLEMAALFHDTGFVKTDKHHEKVSAAIACDFLCKNHMPKEEVSVVCNTILATELKAEPQNLLESIIRDADCGHLASKKYFEISDDLKKELELKTGNEISELEWHKENLSFFNQHRYYTFSAKTLWQTMKENNANELKKKIEKLEKKAKKNSNEGSAKRGRGIETLFRVQLTNHIELSAIADTKANILLSVNAIIISVALSGLVPRLNNSSDKFLIVPTLVLMLFSVASVVLSVLSTRPNVSNLDVTRDMITQKQTNIVFFGNFHRMALKDFEWGVEYLIDNEDALYNSLTKDLYYLGLVLARKYKLLRITYTVFMIGIVLSALTFIISYMAYA